LKACLSADKLVGKMYAYVSLFGLSSLDQLKFAIFEHTQKLRKTLRATGFDTLDELVETLPSARKAMKAATSGSLFSRFLSTDAAQAFAFGLVRDQLVCLDDFERRGDGLQPKDVLGLVSFLREQRGCKIALILNEERLGDEAREEFKTHLEKVVDISLVFRPTSAEAAIVGITDSDPIARQVAENCKALCVTNIRTIRRTLGLVRDVGRRLEGQPPEVFNAAAKSLALFCWCRDQPDEAPSLEYLASRTEQTIALERLDKARPEVDPAGWKSLLNAYGYAWTDDLDLALLDGVRDGYFDEQRLQREAQKIAAKAARIQAAGTWQAAWRRFQDSFGDDADEVLEGLREAFVASLEVVGMGDLAGTVQLFNKLGRPELATGLIRAFVDSRRGTPGDLDLEANPFGEPIEDAEIVAALHAAAPAEPPKCIAEILEGKADIWSPEVIDTLAAAPVEEFHRAFKSQSGVALRQMLANALLFANVVNASPAMRHVTMKAKSALLTIAAESPVNAIRVARLGIRQDAEMKAPNGH
jgi:hypothetical protein